MSLNVGYGSLVESYQKEGNANPPELNSVALTEEEVQAYRDELNKRYVSDEDIPISMPPSTTLARHLMEVSANSSESAVVKDAILRCTMSCLSNNSFVRTWQSTPYQFSCRAADWLRSAFSSVPMQFEPLELHVVDALGQHEVPDDFQQPAKDN